MTKKKNTNSAVDYDGLFKSGKGLFDLPESVDYWLDTGTLALNYICSGKFVGGGVPGGRISELIGDSATGKTLIGVNILRGVQAAGGIPVLLDSEQTFNPEFARKISKLDTDKMFTISADTLEGCFNKIYASIRFIRETVPVTVPIAILWDSIAAAPSDREFAETGLDMENATDSAIKAAGAGRVSRPGERALTCSKHFRNLPKFLKENNAALIVINQFRAKIGVMFGDPTDSAGGGRALKYYGSVRLKLKGAKKTKDKFDCVNGVNLTLECIKNKVYQPFLSAHTLHLLFTKGVNPFGGLLELLIQSERIAGKSGNYYVLEPYAQGREIKFRASKDRNDVSPELLLDCPQLVDADTPAQIQNYIDLYQAAIDGVKNDIAKEDEIQDDE